MQTDSGARTIASSLCVRSFNLPFELPLSSSSLLCHLKAATRACSPSSSVLGRRCRRHLAPTILNLKHHLLISFRAFCHLFEYSSFVLATCIGPRVFLLLHLFSPPSSSSSSSLDNSSFLKLCFFIVRLGITLSLTQNNVAPNEIVTFFFTSFSLSNFPLYHIPV